MKPRPKDGQAAVTLLAPDGSEVGVALAAGDAKTRPCRMAPAYSGAVFEHAFFGPTVIDCAGVKVPEDGIPLYRQHDPMLYVGRSAKVELADAIDVRGYLFVGVEAADEVARISDQGGKWQASVRAEPNLDRIDYVGAENTVTVNGREVRGPCAVWRETYLREASFTPRGVDSSTSGVALSHPPAAAPPAPKPKETTMDPVIAERQRVKAIREAFPKHPKFVDEQVDKGASLAEAKAAFTEIALAELAEKDKAHEAALAAERKTREATEAKLAEAEKKLAKPAFGAALGAPSGGTTGGDPANGETDPIKRWDALLAAELADVRKNHTDEVAELAARRGVSLSDDAHARALAVSRLGQREPKLREAMVAAFNESGIGSRSRNNKR